MSNRHIAALAGGVAAVLLLALATAMPAAAHKKRFQTNLTIGGPGCQFESDSESWHCRLHGYATSPKARCRSGRKVTLSYTYAGESFPIDTLTTDSTGFWLWEEETNFGEVIGATSYQAVASRKTLKKTARHRHICRRAESPVYQNPS